MFQTSLAVDHNNALSAPSLSTSADENDVTQVTDVTGLSDVAQSRFGPITPSSLQPLLASTTSEPSSSQLDVRQLVTRVRPASRDSDVFLFENEETNDDLRCPDAVTSRRAKADSGFVGDGSDESEVAVSQATSARSSPDYKNLQLESEQTRAPAIVASDGDVSGSFTPLLTHSGASAYVNT